jgi:hypothetical protein
MAKADELQAPRSQRVASPFTATNLCAILLCAFQVPKLVSVSSEFAVQTYCEA